MYRSGMPPDNPHQVFYGTHDGSRRRLPSPDRPLVPLINSVSTLLGAGQQVVTGIIGIVSNPSQFQERLIGNSTVAPGLTPMETQQGSQRVDVAANWPPRESAQVLPPPYSQPQHSLGRPGSISTVPYPCPPDPPLLAMDRRFMDSYRGDNRGDNRGHNRGHVADGAPGHSGMPATHDSSRAPDAGSAAALQTFREAMARGFAGSSTNRAARCAREFELSRARAADIRNREAQRWSRAAAANGATEYLNGPPPLGAGISMVPGAGNEFDAQLEGITNARQREEQWMGLPPDVREDGIRDWALKEDLLALDRKIQAWSREHYKLDSKGESLLKREAARKKAEQSNSLSMQPSSSTGSTLVSNGSVDVPVPVLQRQMERDATRTNTGPDDITKLRVALANAREENRNAKKENRRLRAELELEVVASSSRTGHTTTGRAARSSQRARTVPRVAPPARPQANLSLGARTLINDPVVSSSSGSSHATTAVPTAARSTQTPPREVDALGERSQGSSEGSSVSDDYEEVAPPENDAPIMDGDYELVRPSGANTPTRGPSVGVASQLSDRSVQRSPRIGHFALRSVPTSPIERLSAVAEVGETVDPFVPNPEDILSNIRNVGRSGSNTPIGEPRPSVGDNIQLNPLGSNPEDIPGRSTSNTGTRQRRNTS